MLEIETGREIYIYRERERAKETVVKFKPVLNTKSVTFQNASEVQS